MVELVIDISASIVKQKCDLLELLQKNSVVNYET